MNKPDSRYPYTYAADYVRSVAGYNEHGATLSRSDAATIREGFAKALGMSDEDLAKKLADYYKENENSILDKNIKAFFAIRDAQQ